MENEIKKELDGKDFTRLANNFYNSINCPADFGRIIIDSQLSNYVAQHIPDTQKKYKVALTCICLNQHYWEFAKQMIETAKHLLLPGHEVDFFLWSDMTEELATSYGATVFPTEPITWPYPTLLRYNLFLQQEEKLKEYDYIFYCDIDMKFVNVVGDEILGEGLTSAQHPMYALRKEYFPPYEPNSQSEAYIPRPGKIVDDGGKPRFMPLYYAGGFQGGKTESWIKAMKEMEKMIDKDLTKNYIPIWNDESIWNKYLFENPPSVVLTPSYIYPDSLVKEYYEPLWGCSYVPKLITITKKFSLSKEGGDHVAKMMTEIKPLT